MDGDVTWWRRAVSRGSPNSKCIAPPFRSPTPPPAFSATSPLHTNNMAGEPPHKRRRTHDESGPGDFLATFLPTPTAESQFNGLENIDPFLSPATSWGIDEFAHDPNYLASQEELRALLFTTARSVAPTRAGTPVEDDDNGAEPSRDFSVKKILAKGRRVQYLKNYMSAVARTYSPSSK
jgi:hypothetical protein